MFFVEGFRVRTFHLPGGVGALTARARVFGQSSPVSLASFDRDMFSWRTFQLSWDATSTEFSETWPRSGLMRSGTAFRLQPLAPRTGGIGSGLLPTPNEVDLPTAANLWPTPHGMPKPEYARRQGPSGNERLKVTTNNGNGAGMPLTIAVQMWPTPTSSVNSNRTMRRAPSHGVSHGKVLGGEVNEAEAEAGRPRGQLNPTWVEWLMGFPLGWTDLEPSETP